MPRRSVLLTVLNYNRTIINMKGFYTSLGFFLKEKRERAGITHTKLASLIGLTRTSITNIENGNQRLLLHHALPLMKILKIELQDIHEIYSQFKFDSEIEKYNDEEKNRINRIVNLAKESQL